MYTKNIFAAGALLSVAAAVPLAKRDVVWVTETDEAVVTVPVTQTVWVNPGETIPTGSHYGHHWHPSSSGAASSPAVVTVSPIPASSAPAPSAPSSEAAPATTQAAPSSYEAPSSSSVYVAPTTSSVYVAPTTSSTSVYVAPTTEAASSAPAPSSYAAPVSSSSPTTVQASAPAAETCTNSNSGQSLSGAAASGTSYSGDLTWYQTGMGACGCNSGSSDHIVAIAESLFDQFMPSSGNPNMNPLCGKQVSITGADGTAYTASIVDRCTGCKEADLDLSETFFNTVTSNGDGRVHNMKWSFL